jgi:hypothetical protein
MHVFSLLREQESNPKRHVTARHAEWRDNPSWKQSEADAAYFRRHPVGGPTSPRRS